MWHEEQRSSVDYMPGIRCSGTEGSAQNHDSRRATRDVASRAAKNRLIVAEHDETSSCRSDGMRITIPQAYLDSSSFLKWCAATVG